MLMMGLSPRGAVTRRQRSPPARTGDSAIEISSQARDRCFCGKRFLLELITSQAFEKPKTADRTS